MGEMQFGKMHAGEIDLICTATWRSAEQEEPFIYKKSTYHDQKDCVMTDLVAFRCLQHSPSRILIRNSSKKPKSPVYK